MPIRSVIADTVVFLSKGGFMNIELIIKILKVIQIIILVFVMFLAIRIIKHINLLEKRKDSNYDRYKRKNENHN